MLNKIKKIIADQLSLTNTDVIKLDAPFDSMDIDSIDAVEIIMAIEDEFEIQIPDEIAAKFNSVGDIVAYLNTTGIQDHE